MKSESSIRVMAALNSLTPELEDLMLPEILSSPYPYEQGLVKAILADGRQITLETAEEMWSFAKDGCIKIEGMEKLNRKIWDFCNLVRNESHSHLPVSCHVFKAAAGSTSFPDHTDPDGVYLYVVYGEKTMIIDGKEVVLTKGNSVYIPAGTVHRAINKKGSVMLSIGFDRFISEKL